MKETHRLHITFIWTTYTQSCLYTDETTYAQTCLYEIAEKSKLQREADLSLSGNGDGVEGFNENGGGQC